MANLCVNREFMSILQNKTLKTESESKIEKNHKEKLMNLNDMLLDMNTKK